MQLGNLRKEPLARMKKHEFNPPEEKLIRKAISGNSVALYEIYRHYERLMRYKLNKEIKKMSEETGFEEDLFCFEDLLSEIGRTFFQAVMSFKE